MTAQKKEKKVVRLVVGGGGGSSRFSLGDCFQLIVTNVTFVCSTTNYEL